MILHLDLIADSSNMNSPPRNVSGSNKIEGNMTDMLKSLADRFGKIMDNYQRDEMNQLKKNQDLLKKLNMMLEKKQKATPIPSKKASQNA